MPSNGAVFEEIHKSETAPVHSLLALPENCMFDGRNSCKTTVLAVAFLKAGRDQNIFSIRTDRATSNEQ
jgi:hypothetical protein